MKTTIDLPEDLLRRTKVLAAETGGTVKNLVIEGLEIVLASKDQKSLAKDQTTGALGRLKTGFKLGGEFLTRDECHDG